MVRWQTAEGKWTCENHDARFAPPRSEAAAWRQIAGNVKVPENAGKLVVLLGVNGQAAAGDQVWFDDAVLVPRPAGE